MDALKSLVQPLLGVTSSNGLVDGVKLVMLGGTVETARRVSSSAWSHFVNSFFLTAHFSEDEPPYDWLMLWLSKRPEWQRSREFHTTTRTISPGMSNGSTFGDDEVGEENEEGSKTRVLFEPTVDMTHTIFYKGHWLRVKRTCHKRRHEENNALSVSVVARSNSILKQLVLQAKREFEAESIHRIQIYFADCHGGWRWTDSRYKRPLSSIVLEPGVKEMLMDDTRDFLKSEKWYADRGIPFRRGYLLHGVPGSGKSSLIHAIAGELKLDIYVITLSASWMNDSVLTTLMSHVPPRCILLLEDLDAAFTRSTIRDGTSTGAPLTTGGGKFGNTSLSSDEDYEESPWGSSSSRRRRRLHVSDPWTVPEVNTLSLSGLLNSLDGVAASEGRILFATTNHLERLDPALSRPGRMDVWIEFKHASKWQAEALFRNFFPSIEDEELILGHIESEPIDQEEGSTPPTSSPVLPDNTFGASNVAYLPPPADPAMSGPSHTARPLDAATLSVLAKEFADAIPINEFSVAALQGYLLKHKARPEKAAQEASAWVESERALRERLRKEREAREQQEEAERIRLLEEERLQAEKEKADKEKAEKEQTAQQNHVKIAEPPTQPPSNSKPSSPSMESSTWVIASPPPPPPPATH